MTFGATAGEWSQIVLRDSLRIQTCAPQGPVGGPCSSVSLSFADQPANYPKALDNGDSSCADSSSQPSKLHITPKSHSADRQRNQGGHLTRRCPASSTPYVPAGLALTLSANTTHGATEPRSLLAGLGYRRRTADERPLVKPSMASHMASACAVRKSSRRGFPHENIPRAAGFTSVMER